MYDVDSQELNSKAAEELKKVPEIKAPSWATFVKTGMHKERAPLDKDWWYFRIASVLRIVYRLGPVGVSKLRTKYGGKKNRGVKKEHFFRGSGNILRKSLQQLEKAGLVKFAEKGVHKGRIVTPKGKAFLDKIATQIQGQKPKPEEKKAEVKQEQKVDVKEQKTIKPKTEVKTEAKKEVKQEQKTEKKIEIKKDQKVEKKPEETKEKVEPKKEVKKAEEK